MTDPVEKGFNGTLPHYLSNVSVRVTLSAQPVMERDQLSLYIIKLALVVCSRGLRIAYPMNVDEVLDPEGHQERRLSHSGLGAPDHLIRISFAYKGPNCRIDQAGGTTVVRDELQSL